MKAGQRFGLVGAALVTLGLVGALVYYGSQPDYGVLFSDLKPADAQGIIEKLKASAVPYQLSSGGTTVSVPAERVAELRLQMAASGVIAGGHVGFDLFDRTSFGTTDFAQQVNYQRAIEGELARTLESMEEFESVRVHVTRPNESLFTEKAESAKASVLVKVRQGRELARERTEAVVSLVSSAVEGLDPADVSVIDTRGRLLSAAGRDGASGVGAFNSHLEARRKFEAETAARIISLIEPVSGPGHVRADVAANLDFSQVEQTEEKYDPARQVIRSQQTTQEARGGAAGGGQAGIVGARANDPTTQTPAVAVAPQSGAGDQRSATLTNYEIDKTVRRTIDGGGRIQRLSVSVMVDYKNSEGVQVARTPEELQKIQEVVAAAVGIDSQRGDQIVVQTIPFDQPTVETRQPGWQETYRDIINSVIKYGSLLMATLLILFFVVRPARRALRAATASSSHRLSLPSASGDGQRSGTSGGTRSTDGVRQLQGAEDSVDGKPPRTVAEMEAEMVAQIEEKIAREMFASLPEVKRASAIKKHIVDRSQTDSELIAMTLRGWLQENR